MGDDGVDDVSELLRTADNASLSEYRSVSRELIALLKAFDKDLKTLSDFNDNDSNFNMVFNDSELDKAERTHSSVEASRAWEQVVKIVSERRRLR